MKRITGPTLRPRVDAAPLAVDEVTDIGARVAAALHELHRQHVVHLDAKPSTIMLRPDGTAELVDFGRRQLACRTTTTCPTCWMKNSRCRLRSR